MAIVLITGGSGLLGNHLCALLQKNGFDVSVLSRKKNEKTNIKTYLWNYEKGEIDEEAILKADYIIHLAGASIIGKRWTKKRRQELIDSRVKTANLILKKVKDVNSPIKAFISASGVGYYGAITSDKIFSEQDASGNDFLAHLCVLWEDAADSFLSVGTRVVKIRTGVVLDRTDGFFPKLILSTKFFCATTFGSGKQFLPWIHIDDICDMYLKAIQDNEMTGVYNAVAPEHINQKQFIQEICSALKRRIILPGIPYFFVKAMFGKMAVMFLTGSRISSEKFLQKGYRYKFRDIKAAVQNLS